MKILLLASHGIAEYDDIRMFHHLGYEVFCPGGYANPTQPGETLRPALPEVPYYPELAALCDEQRAKHPEEPGPMIDWAKGDLHPDLVDWADVIIVHHFPRQWIGAQWQRIRHKRVIWRTCGQSDPALETFMRGFAEDGLQIVRYSPAERRFFEANATWAGQDALIRFGKFPDDYRPWIPTGHIRFPDGTDGPYIANVTQNMVERGEAVGLSFYLETTQGLPAVPAGPGSKQLPNGLGEQSYEAMLDYLQKARAYIYTGTKPASYTLGLIEAMMAGVPVVSIGKQAFGMGDLFEGDEIVIRQAATPQEARGKLLRLLNYTDPKPPERQRAIELFGMDTIGPQWQAFLGRPDRASQTSPWDAVL